MCKLAVINGPNTNLLGRWQPDVYGKHTLEEINQAMLVKAEDLGLKLDFFQSNHEGALIDRIHAATDRDDGIIINPGAYAHYSYALADALAMAEVPVVEVCLSDIAIREEYRRYSVIKPHCLRRIVGRGSQTYLEALDYFADYFMELSVI
jgi:3-dehydroquinate dehydratase-2